MAYEVWLAAWKIENFFAVDMEMGKKLATTMH